MRDPRLFNGENRVPNQTKHEVDIVLNNFTNVHLVLGSWCCLTRGYIEKFLENVFISCNQGC